ncbi:AraC-like DNA-binding protein [Nocardiopsis mwathae]|uniref:AraC-like DNA-binding protein n=1 Tax=Nocardiopsis mwathae TaxID=1472723 RepID=A0A7W9YHX8_9ACTN|nr:AraC-like DNA-binding protein [Nocardiopsis mwathae]
MDVLSTLLHEVRARSAVFTRSIMDPPWSLRFLDGTPVTLVSMVRGRGWITPEGGDPVPIDVGDAAVLIGGAPFGISDAPDTPTSVTVHGTEVCVGPDGVPIGEGCRLDDYTWGTDPDGRDAFLMCGYQVAGEVAARVLAVLPPLVVLDCDGSPCAEAGLILDELARQEPGRQVVLDRLLDLLLVSTLRDWFARDATRVPGWYRAMGDPVVGTALRLMHDAPASPWTVAGLAERSGASRAAFARRFADLVGEPPMAYLTGWRMAVAADLLRGTRDTVGAVARRVGYADAFALSTAFKRAYGVRPSEYRAAAAPVAAATG